MDGQTDKGEFSIVIHFSHVLYPYACPVSIFVKKHTNAVNLPLYIPILHSAPVKREVPPSKAAVNLRFLRVDTSRENRENL